MKREGQRGKRKEKVSDTRRINLNWSIMLSKTEQTRCEWKIKLFFVNVFFFKLWCCLCSLSNSSLLPLQFMDLFLLVVLLILHLPKDFQKPFDFRMGLPGILSAPCHFLLQGRDTFSKLSVGLGLRCCTLSLEQKLLLKINLLLAFEMSRLKHSGHSECAWEIKISILKRLTEPQKNEIFFLKSSHFTLIFSYYGPGKKFTYITINLIYYALFLAI